MAFFLGSCADSGHKQGAMDLGFIWEEYYWGTEKSEELLVVLCGYIDKAEDLNGLKPIVCFPLQYIAKFWSCMKLKAKKPNTFKSGTEFSVYPSTGNKKLASRST